MRTDFESNGAAPTEHRQAYAQEVTANVLEDILEELKKLTSHFKGESAKADLI